MRPSSGFGNKHICHVFMEQPQQFEGCSMFSPTGSGLRRAVFGAVLVLGLPMLAACDNEGPEGAAERAGKAIDNTASSAAKQTGEAMENVGNAIQKKSREVSESMDDKRPSN
jgi:hypothetical protein